MTDESSYEAGNLCHGASIDLRKWLALGLMAIVLQGCKKVDASTRAGSIELTREFSFPDIGMEPKAVATDKQGNVVVVVGAIKGQGFAMATNRDGKTLWRYQHAPDAASGYKSSFESTLQLEDGNFLLCGYQSRTNDASTGLMLIVDPGGHVIEQRLEQPENNVALQRGTFTHCVRWQSGVAAIGRTSEDQRSAFWIATLDGRGRKLRDRVVRENLPSMEVTPTTDGGLTLSNYDGIGLQMMLVKINPAGDVVARRTIKSFGSVLLRSVKTASVIQTLNYGVGNTATLHTLNEDLRDYGHSSEVDFDARKSCGFSLPDGSALLFGRTTNAAAVLVGHEGTVVSRFTFDAKFKSFAVNDAYAVSPTEFVTVRYSVSADPKNQGLVVSWLKISN